MQRWEALWKEKTDLEYKRDHDPNRFKTRGGNLERALKRQRQIEVTLLPRVVGEVEEAARVWDAENPNDPIILGGLPPLEYLQNIQNEYTEKVERQAKLKRKQLHVVNETRFGGPPIHTSRVRSASASAPRMAAMRSPTKTRPPIPPRQNMQEAKGKVGLYRMSPLNSPSEAVPCKSDVMYELKSYHSQDVVDINDNLHVQNGVAQEDDSLELRQSKVIDRLQNLKKTLEDLTSCEKKAALNAAEVIGLEKDIKFSSESLVFAGLSQHQMSPTIQTTPVPELDLKLEEFVQNVVEKTLLDTMQDISVQLPIGQPHSWIIVLRQLLNDRCFPKMQVSTFYHSSVPQAQIDSSSPSWVLSSNSNVKFRILWRQEFLGPAMCFSPSVPLLIGLSSVSKAIGCVLGIYPASDQPINRVREDYWIDVAASIQASNKKLRQAAIKELNVALGNSKSKFLLGERAGLCDIILFTCLSDLKLIDCPPSNVAKWKDTCKALGIQLQ